MAGVRRGARSVMKWFAALYVVAIIVQVYLAGEGIFGINNVKHADDCKKIAAACAGGSGTLDAHRGLGFFITMPGAFLFLVVALLAWHPNVRIRTVSIVLPFLTFLQMILAGLGRWAAALHPVNAILVLALFGWLAYRLRQEQPEEAVAAAPVVVPTG